MKAAVAVGVVLLVAVAAVMVMRGLGDEAPPLQVDFVGELHGATRLRMDDSPPRRQWQYKLEVKSAVRQPVRLAVEFTEPAPPGMRVTLAGQTLIARQATDYPTLVFVVPEAVGPFEGAARIVSPDVPGWSVTYPFAGNVSETGLKGKRLRPRPAGVDLGPLRPGDRRPFAVKLQSFGDEEVTIRELRTGYPDNVLLPASFAPATVPPAGEVELAGILIAPGKAGPFEATVEVYSDATNYPRALGVRVRCEVVPDYAPLPPSLERDTEFPALQPEYRVVIRAREGVEPFRIESVSGGEAYLEVISKGGDAPAREQEAVFRLRRDAPANPAEPRQFGVLFRIEPGAKEILWPVRLRLFPPIYASPSSLRWGDDLAPREIRLASIPGRSFKVKSAVAQQGRFEVFVQAQPGMVPTILVSVRRGTPAGTVQDHIVIETDDPDVPKIIVPAYAKVR